MTSQFFSCTFLVSSTLIITDDTDECQRKRDLALRSRIRGMYKLFVSMHRHAQAHFRVDQQIPKQQRREPVSSASTDSTQSAADEEGGAEDMMWCERGEHIT